MHVTFDKSSSKLPSNVPLLYIILVLLRLSSLSNSLGIWKTKSPFLTVSLFSSTTIMSTSKFMLVSLPTSISPSGGKEEALNEIKANIGSEARVVPFRVPDFKIGTLDALVQQADDLAKLESVCEAVVAKVGDSLKNLLEGDEGKIAQQKTVNDKPAEQYLRAFSWNKVKYRADKPLAELIDSLQKVGREIWLAGERVASS